MNTSRGALRVHEPFGATGHQRTAHQPLSALLIAAARWLLSFDRDIGFPSAMTD